MSFILSHSDLDFRRVSLGMSRRALAERSGASLATVNRILDHGFDHATFANVRRLVLALGMELRLTDNIDPDTYRGEVARAKARQLAAHVQANSALEKQALSDRDMTRIESDIERRLLTGPRRKLWAR